MTEYLKLYHFNTEGLNTDENICANTLDNALKKYRTIHPTGKISDITLEKSNVVV